MPLQSEQQIQSKDDIAYFFSIDNIDKTSESIESILQLPYSIFVEKSPHNATEQLLKDISSNTPDMALSITTASCYAGNLTHPLTNLISKRFNLNEDKVIKLSTCLHEAIMNAILHGNLNMQSDFRTLDGLCAYQAEITQRLNVDMYKSRRIQIKTWDKDYHLKIAITDEGNGFSIPTKAADDTLPNGRGLRLINYLADSMWVELDKRTLFMTFAK